MFFVYRYLLVIVLWITIIQVTFQVKVGRNRSRTYNQTWAKYPQEPLSKQLHCSSDEIIADVKVDIIYKQFQNSGTTQTQDQTNPYEVCKNESYVPKFLQGLAEMKDHCVSDWSHCEAKLDIEQLNETCCWDLLGSSDCQSKGVKMTFTCEKKSKKKRPGRAKRSDRVIIVVVAVIVSAVLSALLSSGFVICWRKLKCCARSNSNSKEAKRKENATPPKPKSKKRLRRNDTFGKSESIYQEISDVETSESFVENTVYSGENSDGPEGKYPTNVYLNEASGKASSQTSLNDKDVRYSFERNLPRTTSVVGKREGSESDHQSDTAKSENTLDNTDPLDKAAELSESTSTPKHNEYEYAYGHFKMQGLERSPHKEESENTE